MEITALLVDDEPPARDELRYLLEAYPEIKIIDEAFSGQEAIEKVDEKKPDVVFLDIKLWDMDGFEVARNILQKEKSPLIIFATAYDEFAVKAFELNAVDYILKPFFASRIEKTVNKLIEIFRNRKEKDEILKVAEYLRSLEKPCCKKLSFWKNNRIHLINPEEICYCEAEEKGSKVKTIYGEFYSAYTLTELEEKINSPNFFRAHKSYLVNLEKVKEIIPWFGGTYLLSIQGYEKDEVPVSRRQAKELKRIFDI